MGNIIDAISGNVPGGIILLSVALVIINLSLYFFRKSGLIDKGKVFKNQLTLSFAAIAVYLAFWFALKPPPPPVQIIILPAAGADGQIALNAESFYLAEIMQKAAPGNSPSKYLWHRWPWLFETVGGDSAVCYAPWIRAALAMNPGILIEQIKTAGNDRILVRRVQSSDSRPAEYELNPQNGYGELIRAINADFKFYRTAPAQPALPDANLLNTRLAYLSRDYNKTLELIGNAGSAEAQILMAAVYVKTGLQQKLDRAKAAYVKTENPDFAKARQILSGVVRQQADTPEAACLLARMALRDSDYPGMDVFLKKALADDITDSRVYLLMSYLLTSRLEEIGFKRRAEVLERAIYFDPGYRDAVHELANEYYITGTGTQGASGTTSALELITNFLKIKSGDPQILSLLGSIYLKIQRFDDALHIFTELNQRFPEDTDTYYNLGIAWFMKKDYPAALQQFEKAIAMGEHLDAYLYAGITCRMAGDREKALYYYRERVKRKTSDDDKYAVEAMTGIRKILLEIEDEQKK
jgi:tetratricopeptide (TPR) repeat protein